MYINVNNLNYGLATSTYANYIAIANPDLVPYNMASSSIYHTGSVDCYKYNKGADEHLLINTLYRPQTPVDILLTTETSSILNTEDWTELALDAGKAIEVQNSFGTSVDLIDNQLVVGCPYYLQTLVFNNMIVSTSGSAAYVFNVDSGLAIQTIPNSSSINTSFGTSVSINQDWLAVGCPAENNSMGSVFLYNLISGSWNLFQEISASNLNVTSASFGYSLKLNKDTSTSSGRMVVGCGNVAANKVFLFEFDGTRWNQTYIFTPDYSQYPLTFGNYTPYNTARNQSSSFGSSVSMYGDSIIIGEYLDRIVYEYNGSPAYSQGSVSIFERCSPSSSYFNQVYKTYGNEKILKNNNLGYSVDIFNGFAVAGIPRSNQNSITPCYLENTLTQYYQCDDNIVNSLNGQVALFTNESGSWDIKNIFQKRKEYLSPYRVFGRSVSVGSYSMVVGAPLFVSLSEPTNINITTTQSNDVTLDDICGKSYIYNLNNLQDSFHIGNVFYRNGKIVLMTSGSIFQNLFDTTDGSENYSYNLNFNGEHTIYEKQIICSVSPGEFNVSTNPTSLIPYLATFDLNSNGSFDYEDLEIIMRYMAYKNTQAMGLPVSTAWSASLSFSPDEISLINYYKSGSLYNETYISQQVANYIPIWDYTDTSIQTDLDVNGDNIIDVRDMAIVWKYFSNRLNQKNYLSYITPNSSRKTLSQVIDYLDNLSGRNRMPEINPYFFNYKNNITQDPTGSYLCPMVTSIGLYDKNMEMVAMAKLGTPIQLNSQLPVNFCVKMDF